MEICQTKIFSIFFSLHKFFKNIPNRPLCTGKAYLGQIIEEVGDTPSQFFQIFTYRAIFFNKTPNDK